MLRAYTLHDRRTCARTLSDSACSRCAAAAALTANTSVIMVDYFWIMAGYYSSNYGLNWLTEKVHGWMVVCVCE